MSNTELLMKEAQTVPADFVDEVIDFIRFIKQKAPKAGGQERLLTPEEFEAGIMECPMDHTPNAGTIAAMEEGDAILRGEIPAKWHSTPEELFKDLGI
jgi:hypothetical protein